MDKGIFLGYSGTSKAFRVFSRNSVVEKSIHFKFSFSLTIDKKLLDLKNDFANMQIGLFDASKVDKVKQSDEDLL